MFDFCFCHCVTLLPVSILYPRVLSALYKGPLDDWPLFCARHAKFRWWPGTPSLAHEGCYSSSATFSTYNFSPDQLRRQSNNIKAAMSDDTMADTISQDVADYLAKRLRDAFPHLKTESLNKLLETSSSLIISTIKAE